jgi:hypothetical protein
VDEHPIRQLRRTQHIVVSGGGGGRAGLNGPIQCCKLYWNVECARYVLCMYGRRGPVIHRSCRRCPPPLFRNPTRSPNSSTPTGPGEGCSLGIQDSLDRRHDRCPARPPPHAKLAVSTVPAHAPHHRDDHRMMASADILTSVAPPDADGQPVNEGSQVFPRVILSVRRLRRRDRRPQHQPKCRGPW